MKPIHALVMSLALFFVAPAHAQQPIEKSFAHLRKVVKMEVYPNIVRDPATMQVEGSAEVYEFVVSERNRALIDTMREAFLASSATAYKVYSANDHKHQRRLTYTPGNAVTIGRNYINHIAALFADATRPGYRTAYCLEWSFPYQGEIRARFSRVYGPNPKSRPVASPVAIPSQPVTIDDWQTFVSSLQSVLDSIASSSPIHDATACQQAIAGVESLAQRFMRQHPMPPCPSSPDSSEKLNAAVLTHSRDSVEAALVSLDFTPACRALLVDVLLDADKQIDIHRVVADANLRDPEKMMLIMTQVTRQAIRRLR